jgi:hypothetical protein
METTSRSQEGTMQTRPHAGLRAIKLSLVAAVGLIALLALPSLASARDRNHDRIPDRWEKRHHLSLHVNQARRDQDRDQLGNRGEFRAHMNPRDDDSDNDGTEDGDENAGTIDMFDDGVLTISLFGGGSVSGQVTDRTEIECEGQDENEAEGGDDRRGDVAGRHQGGDNSGPSDNSGPGNGDDNDEDENADCTTADLTAGTVVREADLRVGDGQAVFEEVELVK